MAADMDPTNSDALINDSDNSIPSINIAALNVSEIAPNTDEQPDVDLVGQDAQRLIQPANTNTLVDESPQGVPIVNITAPDAARVSHNIYRHFNIPVQGAVLNNSTELQTETTLAGIIERNPNFKGISASLIINEVVSSHPSVLKGALEVAGNKEASVIIANPNGITCDGCDFMHTPNVTLTTGILEFDNHGQWHGLDMMSPARREEIKNKAIDKQADKTYSALNTIPQWSKLQAQQSLDGKIIIEGKDLRSYSRIYKLSLIANTIDINNLYTKSDLKLITGSDRYNINTSYSHNNLCTIDGHYNIDKNAKYHHSNEYNLRPELTIDVSALGGLTAGSITIIANDKGAGVNLNNMMASTGYITLNTQGKIKSNNTVAGSSITISDDGVQLTGILSSTRAISKPNHLKIKANALDNLGTISAQEFHFSGAKMNNSGHINAEKNIQIDASDVLTQSNNGKMVTNSLHFDGGLRYPEINKNHIDTAGLLIAKTSSISARSWYNQGDVNSGGLQWSSCSSEGIFNNSGTVSVENEFYISGSDILFNSGAIQANTIRMYVPLLEIHNSSEGTIISQVDIPFRSYGIENKGTISVAGKTPTPFKHTY